MKKLLILALVLSAGSGFSQIEICGKITDSKSGKAIPYANVYLKNNSVGTTAYRDGSFRLKLDSVFQDSVIFSIIGYGKQSFYLPDLTKSNYVEVSLTPIQEKLPEVEVKPRKLKSYEAGLRPRLSKHCSGLHRNHSDARWIPNESKVEGFIKLVAVYVCQEGIYDASFRVNLLSVDFKSGRPSAPLVSRDFIVQAVKGNEWVQIDLSQELVKFPIEGFFVSLSVLPIDSLQMNEYRERLPGYTDRQISYSAPVFGHSFEPYAEASEYNWQKGWIHEEWVSYWKELYEGRDTLYSNSDRFSGPISASSLMIKAEISYYADQGLTVKELKTKREVKKVLDRPKENTLEYPQSSPGYLMASLKKAIEQDDFAYMCSYLLYYENEDELEETMDFVAAKKNEMDSVLFSQKEKDEMITSLTELEMNLDNLKATEDDRFIFELEHEGAMFYFQNKNGAWKIGPKSSRLVEQTREVKSSERF